MKSWIWMMILLLLSTNALALGLAPGHVDITFEPNGQHRNTLKILNNDKADIQVILYVEGELAPYLKLDDSIITMMADEPEKYTSYTLTLPNSFEKQGLHTSNIVARAIPMAKGSDATMSATVAIASQINVMVPYSGKYSEITLFSPNFEFGKESNFAVEARNLGTEDTLDAQVIIEIFGPMNNKITTLSSDKFQLQSKQKQLVTLKWNPDIGLGNYRAVASLVYSGGSARDERQFSIGKFTIDIVDITVKDFKLGGIAMFDIMLENRWNEKIPGVYGTVSVKDANGKSYTSFKTATVDLNDNEKQSIQAYWDTKSVGPGSYKLDIVLSYLGQQSEKVFDIIVSTDKIQTNLAGQVVSAEQKSTSPVLQGIYILTFLVIALIILNVIIFFRKQKEKK
jgi:hypothetical protein